MSISLKRGGIRFKISFRIVCAQVLEYWHNQENLPPKYYDCPAWCGDKQTVLNGYCRACPVQTAEKEFRSETIALLDKRVGADWKKYEFDSLLNTVYQVSSMVDKDDSEWTMLTAGLVRIFQGEQAKRQRIDNYNRNQALKKN